MLKKIFLSVLILTSLVSACNSENENNYEKTNANKDYSVKLASSHDKVGNIVWSNFSDGVKVAKENNKKMFIEFYTDWCTYCKKMEKETFTNQKVYDFMNKNFISIKVNAESSNKIKFNGKDVTEKELASMFGVTGYPTLFFMNSETEAVGQLPGFVQSEQLYDIANYVFSDSYKTLSFEEFKKKSSS